MHVWNYVKIMNSKYIRQNTAFKQSLIGLLTEEEKYFYVQARQWNKVAYLHYRDW